jgi:hypothetical protein
MPSVDFYFDSNDHSAELLLKFWTLSEWCLCSIVKMADAVGPAPNSREGAFRFQDEVGTLVRFSIH